MIRSWIPPESSVLEIGARYGSTSCTIAERQNQSGKVVAVEPDYVVWGALEKNLENFKCNVTLVKGVVGTKDVQMEHHGIHGYGTNASKATDVKGRHVAPHFTLEQVQTQSGLHFDVAVIDCEGCLP